MSTLTPKDHAEAIALFRSEIVGALTRRELDRGELVLVLTELSQQRFRPPRATSTKAYSIPTLERGITHINQAVWRHFGLQRAQIAAGAES